MKVLERAAVFEEKGAEALRRGELATARASFEQALALRRQALGDAHMDVGASLHNLGTVLAAQGDLEAAVSCHAEALRIWEAALGPERQVLAKPLGALSVLARRAGEASAAVGYARRALAIRIKVLAEDDPRIAASLDDYGMAQALAGEDREAMAAWQAALRIFTARGMAPRLVAPLLNNLGVSSRALGDLVGAKTWFGRAVEADPDLAQARHNLAAALARLGEADEAAIQREAALRRQSVFVQRAARGRADVLIVSVSDKGNVPLEHVLPEPEFTRIWWFIAHARQPLAADLPRYDVVFNGIGDPDMAGPAEANFSAFMDRACARRVLNQPDRVARTRRDILAKTLAGIDGLVVPPTDRLVGVASPARIQAAGIAPPFLLRPAGAHGGAGVSLVQTWTDVDVAALATAHIWYVTQFIDYRSPDDFFRKYRMAFVDGRIYPYHLAISDNWLVHYFSADMEAHPWKLAEEAAFLHDPRAVLGDRGYAAIGEAARRLELDFCGMDFGILPDGRIVVFEANATMLIHPESEAGQLAFKNPAVRVITDAVAQLITERKEDVLF